jgi:hypothetical protein
MNMGFIVGIQYITYDYIVKYRLNSIFENYFIVLMINIIPVIIFE